MKKTIFSILLLASALFFCACGNDLLSKFLELREEYKYGDWAIGVDEPTGEKFIRQVIFGDFSNSATASSDLSVTVDIYKDENGLNGEIRFDEYCDGICDMRIGKSWRASSTGSKIVDKSNRQIFYYNPLYDNFENKEESKIYNWIEIFQSSGIYDVTIKGEYKTEYRFTINTEKMDLALKDAGIILEDSTSLFE